MNSPEEFKSRDESKEGVGGEEAKEIELLSKEREFLEKHKEIRERRRRHEEIHSEMEKRYGSSIKMPDRISEALDAKEQEIIDLYPEIGKLEDEIGKKRAAELVIEADVNRIEEI